jgi:hypothetical protein
VIYCHIMLLTSKHNGWQQAIKFVFSTALTCVLAGNATAHHHTRQACPRGLLICCPHLL